MLKKVMSVAVVLAMCLILISSMPLAGVVKAISGFSGAGTANNPYKITSADDLKRLADTVNGGENCEGLYFRLTADIDLEKAGACGKNIGGKEVSWTPIGASQTGDVNFSGTAFSGIFDGDNKKISGLYINAPDYEFQSLFGYVRAATIKNLSVDGYVKGKARVGGIVGYNDAGTIDNCRNSCDVENTIFVDSKYMYGGVGGIAGINSKARVQNCYNTGSIYAVGQYAGGIVGSNGKSSIVENCRNDGKIAGEHQVGGIVGSNSESTVNKCYNSGEIEGHHIIKNYIAPSAGGIAGEQEQYSSPDTIKNCYNIGKISTDKYGGGIVGGIASFRGSCTVENCYNMGQVGQFDGLPGTSIIAGGIVGVVSYNPTMKNCYSLEGTAKRPLVGFNGSTPGITIIDSSSITRDFFTSGEVAYLLQAGQEDGSGQVWGQHLTVVDKDKYEHENEVNYADSPILTDDTPHKVLKVTFMFGSKTLEVKYVNPDCKVDTPTEGWPEPPEGSGRLGWTTVKGGTTAEFYDTVTVGDRDVIFYLTFPFAYPDVTPPQPRNRSYNGEEEPLVEAGRTTGGTLVYSLYENEGYTENIPMGKDAGKYTVWYKVEGDDYYYGTDPQKVDVIIDKAAPDVTAPEPRNRSYNGEEEPLVEAGKTTGGTLVYSLDENKGYTGNIPKGKDAGEYTVWYKVIGDGNCYGTDPQSVDVIIDKAVPNVTAPEPRNRSYNGDEEPLVEAGKTTGGTLVYRLDENEGYTEDIPMGKDAGEYTVWYKVEGDDNYHGTDPESVEVTISNIYPEIIPPTRNTLTYNGEYQQLVKAGTTTAGTMVYSLDENEGYTEDIPMGKDAGEYTVWYKVIGDGYFDGTEPESVPVTIDKAYSYVKTNPEPINREYDGEEKPLVTEGTAEGGTMVYCLSEDGEYTETVPVGKETDTYRVYYKVIGDNNHYDSERTYSVTVVIFSAGQEMKPPTAKEPVPVYEPITRQELIEPGWASNGTMLYRLPDDEEYSDNIPTGIDAGVYTVYYMVKGNTGYNDIGPNEDEYYVTAAIAKADPKPTIPELAAVRGQTLADVVWVSEGVVGLPEGFAWVDETQSVGDVGKNEFDAIYTPKDTQNYNTIYVKLTVTVTDVEVKPQDPVVTFPQAKQGLVYSRSEQELITAGSATNGTMVYKTVYESYEEQETVAYAMLLSEEEDYFEAVPTGTDAGVYTVYYKVIGDDGYNSIMPNEPLTVFIAKADPVPTIPELAAVYGQTLADVELPDGFTWNDDKQSVGDVGENSFVATFTPKDIKNFNTISVTLTVRVTRPEPPAEETTTSAAIVTTSATTTTRAVTATTAATTTTTAVTATDPAITTAATEPTTATTAAIATETPVGDSSAAETTTVTAAPVTEVTFFVDIEDKNQNTGVALAVIPFVAAAVGAVISKKRK